jgi:hypothetical protein
MITGTLAHLRLDRAWHPERVEFTDDDLDDLWQRWLRPFAGTGEGDGWLDLLDDAAQASSRTACPNGSPKPSPPCGGSPFAPAAATADASSRSSPSSPPPSPTTWSNRPT